MAIQEISAKSVEPKPVPKDQVTDDSQDGLLDEEKLEKVFIGSIDQGTTSTRFIIFDGMGEVSSQLHVVEMFVTDLPKARCATPDRIYPTLPPVRLARA
jgi:glycerol kinase